MKQINWGFIGCGEVTEKKSGPAFNEVEGSRVIAVMSRTEKRARSYAERHHVPKWYTDAQEIINEVCEAALAFGDFAKEAGVPGTIVKQMMPEFRTYLKQ